MCGGGVLLERERGGEGETLDCEREGLLPASQGRLSFGESEKKMRKQKPWAPLLKKKKTEFFGALSRQSSDD